MVLLLQYTLLFASVLILVALGGCFSEHSVIELHVAPSDMGKVIGKQGRIAKAIRAVVKAASTRENLKVDVEIV